MKGREPFDLDDRDVRDRAVAAARGDAAFDLLIENATLFDSVTGALRSADIGIVGPLIASVHPRGARSDADKRLEGSGKIVTPGLIDTHMHIESSMVTPAHYAEAVLPRGVTTIVWDPHELANVHGIAGVEWAIEATSNLPLRCLLLAPSCVPSAPGHEQAGADFDNQAVDALLQDPAIVGVAEIMNMRGVIDRSPRISGIVQAGLASGKLLCGHARGLTGADLEAFATAGVSSDHELVSAADFLHKLEAGLTIELRGSHDHLLPEIVAALNKLGHLPPTVTLCTDDVFPDDLARDGGLDDVVRRLVGHGMPTSWALRAATINASLRLQRPDLGIIAPGRRADLVLFEDVTEFIASHVVANGQIVASDGKLSHSHPEPELGQLRHSLHRQTVSPADFRIKSEGRRVRVATIDQPRFTRWGEAEAAVKDGHVVPPDSATLISVIHRHGRADPVPRTGFLTGWGQWRGAFCTTISHDSHNLTVIGGTETDMATAANAVIEMDGGMAVAVDGQVVASLPLPLSGLLSDASISSVADEFTAIRTAMDSVVEWQEPYLVFKACFGTGLACNAGPHQTDMGIADVSQDAPLVSPVLEIIE